MTTAAFTIYPKFQAFDANGDPASGALLFTYLAGTTTKQTAYTTPAASVAQTNPVVLDSRGEANLCLDGTVLYKLVLAPSTDSDPPVAPIWTVDNVGQTATNIYFTQAGSGASARTMRAKERDTVSVMDFAVTAGTDPGDGTLDASVPLLASYNAVKTVGGAVYCPAPSSFYSLQTQLNFTRDAGATSAGVTFISAGSMDISGGKTAPFVGKHNGHMFDCSGNESLVFENFCIGTDDSTIPKTGWHFARNSAGSSAGKHRLINCRCYDKFTQCVVYSYASEEVELIACHFTNTYTAGVAQVVISTAYNVSNLYSAFLSKHLAFTGQTVNFAAGEIVTGVTSGATGTISSQTDSGSTGVLVFSSQTGNFTHGETLTGSIAGNGTANLGYSNTVMNVMGGGFHNHGGGNADVFYLDSLSGFNVFGSWMLAGDGAATTGRALIYVDLTTAASDNCTIIGLRGENTGNAYEQNYGIYFSNPSSARSCTGWKISGCYVPNRTNFLYAVGANITLDNFQIDTITEAGTSGGFTATNVQKSTINAYDMAISIATASANNLIIGNSAQWTLPTSTTDVRIDLSAGNVQFATTTWTPNLAGLTGSGTPTSTNPKYTRVGNLVSGRVQIQSSAGMGSALNDTIANLPVAAAYPSAAVHVANGSTQTTIGQGSITGTTMYLPAITLGAGVAALIDFHYFA